MLSKQDKDRIAAKCDELGVYHRPVSQLLIDNVSSAWIQNVNGHQVWKPSVDGDTTNSAEILLYKSIDNDTLEMLVATVQLMYGLSRIRVLVYFVEPPDDYG
jgi:hypothetical protein